MKIRWEILLIVVFIMVAVLIFVYKDDINNGINYILIPIVPEFSNVSVEWRLEGLTDPALITISPLDSSDVSNAREFEVTLSNQCVEFECDGFCYICGGENTTTRGAGRWQRK